ncbi:tRNA epoxyqueuosine(34) reductase QueG [Pseudohoeflea coraliihabitans]|uniref:Epoxyqueuosine reductase n=1 Tax=Pseudohoeflea coraliihabitans TaxID=2860393 RepID=A0ABS6WSY8_9HYPH|nr:tRNA epoxyqueuosine(34) reductase QueG [Pseudohoeflea sp. DP4N28-3]MBW3099067.1 tRNA epoxyqueuosine(34) reductase QueG [Pseudohoeflea sp. DP4N28-3]
MHARDSAPEPAKLAAFLDAETRRLGFAAWGIADPAQLGSAGAHLRTFLAEGRHGSMHWLADRSELRADPRRLWPETRSVLMLAMNYGPENDPLALLSEPDKAAISVYARHRDYHDIIKGRLKEMAGRLVARFGGDVKVFVDTAPVMEKPLAAAAGIGWQGKHTNLLSRRHGSWLFLGAIFSTLELPADKPEEDHCGSCRACLDICPTAAFPAPYQLDARRCISYLTIEHKGQIPRQFRRQIGNRIYGCDDCLAVCPWNKFAVSAAETRLQARHDLLAPPIADFLALDDAAFRKLFSGSPVKRIGRDRFLRNVLIAAGNSGEAALIPACRALIDDPAPVVRGAAVWALTQLLPAADFAELKTRRLGEKGRSEMLDPDPDVAAEWDHTAREPVQ